MFVRVARNNKPICTDLIRVEVIEWNNIILVEDSRYHGAYRATQQPIRTLDWIIIQLLLSATTDRRTYVSQLSQNNVGQGDDTAVGKGLAANIPHFNLRTESLQLRLCPVHHGGYVRTGLWPSGHTLDGHCLSQDIDVALFVLVDVSAERIERGKKSEMQFIVLSFFADRGKGVYLGYSGSLKDLTLQKKTTRCNLHDSINRTVQINEILTRKASADFPAAEKS